MSLSQQHIRNLDKSLARAGEPVQVRRLTGTSRTIVADVPCAAHIRGYRPEELIQGSGIAQTDVKMILSPTDLASFPGIIPVRNDPIIRLSNNKQYVVQTATGLYTAGVLVRVELQARGG